jgi:sulfide dehydrogenase cytochrome subunit
MPSIAAASPDYFIDSMKAYKAGTRDSTIMTRIAKAYSEDDIKAMANFFAKQKLALYPQQHDAGKAKIGAKLHDEFCEKCHEEGGRQPSESGILAGQWMPYLQYSMADFQAGVREMPKKMKRKVEDLHQAHGDAGIDALIHYYVSQK